VRTESTQRNMARRHSGVWWQLCDGHRWEVFVRQPSFHTAMMQTNKVSITWHQHTWGCKCSFAAANSTCTSYAVGQTAACAEANATCSKKQECSCQHLILTGTAKALSYITNLYVLSVVACMPVFGFATLMHFWSQKLYCACVGWILTLFDLCSVKMDKLCFELVNS